MLEAASGSVNDDEPYAMSDLYLVGLLRIYKKFSVSTPVQKAMIMILKRLAAHMIDYINQRKTPGKLPMVCSQFVFQCFEDTGGEYRLHIQNPVLALAAGVAQPVSALDLAIQRLKQDRTPAFRSFLSAAAGAEVTAAPEENDETLAEELMQALRAEQADESAGIEDELVLSVTQFCSAAHASVTNHALEPEILLRSNQLGAARVPWTSSNQNGPTSLPRRTCLITRTI